MKKTFISIVICICTTVFTFANSNHDLQFHGGVGLDSRKIELKGVEISAEMKPILFTLDIQNWNFWEISDLIDVGFKVASNMSFGKSSSLTINIPHIDSLNINESSYAWDVNFSIGPAITFKCTENFNLNIAADLTFNCFNGFWFNNGLPTEFYAIGLSDCSLYKKCLGFDFDVQAKLFPHKNVSPLIGYRFSTCFPNSLSVVTDYDLSTEDEPFLLEKGVITSNNIYLGLSINF